MIIAIDFDGTIVEDCYPEIGNLKEGAKEVINNWFCDGNQIIINTCRTAKLEGKCIDFLNDNGILYSFVNCNIPSQIEAYASDSRKISADIYIDDKSLFGLPTWEAINLIVKTHENYSKIMCIPNF